MLFNSIEFAVFLPVVFVVYWFVLKNSLRGQNLLLLFAGYFFYGWWDVRFLGLLFFSTFLDYFSGLQIHQAPSRQRKKLWLLISVIANLGFLGFFKYYNFFAESFAALLTQVGLQPNLWTLQIILPVGISFYTFHGLSYVFDIYNGKTQPTKQFVEYGVFVCFFPLLVAGPIERATHLLPQFFKSRVFNAALATQGLRLILWGLFKKMAVADNCSKVVDEVFTNYSTCSGIELSMGAVFFAIQIYCDFSGYSDIAMGSARLFGFELLTNFKTPYFSRDIAEFWRRWHISLTTWFRDYVYIPLGGSKGGAWSAIRNTIVIFLLSGFWHGANWTFVFWGALNALYFVPLLLTGTNRNHVDTVASGRMLPNIKELAQMAFTFSLVCVAWILFRSDNLQAAFGYFSAMASNTFAGFSLSAWNSILLVPIGFWLLVDWTTREAGVSEVKGTWRLVAFDIFLILLILAFGSFSHRSFIYFQF